MALGGIGLGGVAEGFNSGLETQAKFQALRDAREKVVRDEADKIIGRAVDLGIKTIDAGRAANQPPEKVTAALQPVVSAIGGLYTKLGRDPAPIIGQLTSLASVPAPLPKPETELGKLHTDFTNGRITQTEFDSRVNRLTAPAHQPNTVETVRQKLAAGQPLTAGERQVYDDALKANPLARLLVGAQGTDAFSTPSGTTPAPAAPVVPVAPAAAAPVPLPPARPNATNGTAGGIPWSLGQ